MIKRNGMTIDLHAQFECESWHERESKNEIEKKEKNVTKNKNK